MKKKKIALVVSHPIQHFCPQYASFAQNSNVDFKVFFASKLGLEKYIDANFKTEISWGNLYLDEFNHVFVNGDQVLQPDKNLDSEKLELYLDDFSPDLLIQYGYFQLYQRRAKKWANLRGIPIAYISDAEWNHNPPFFKKILKSIFLANYFRGIDYFLTVGDANEAFYKSLGVKSSALIRMHFPIDIKVYQKAYANRASLRDAVRSKYGLSAEDKVALVVGKLVEWKNQDHLLELMHKLKDKESRIKLIIAGSGPKEDDWKRKSSDLNLDNVIFAGFVHVTDLPSFYAASDVYIHPASLEPHSIAISEAIYMGLPIICSNRCGSWGPSDDVIKGKNGAVYEFGKIDQLQEIFLNHLNGIETLSGDLSHEIALKYQNNSHRVVMNLIAEKC